MLFTNKRVIIKNRGGMEIRDNVKRSSVQNIAYNTNQSQPKLREQQLVIQFPLRKVSSHILQILPQTIIDPIILEPSFLNTPIEPPLLNYIHPDSSFFITPLISKNTTHIIDHLPIPISNAPLEYPMPYPLESNFTCIPRMPTPFKNQISDQTKETPKSEIETKNTAPIIPVPVILTSKQSEVRRTKLKTLFGVTSPTLTQKHVSDSNVIQNVIQTTVSDPIEEDISTMVLPFVPILTNDTEVIFDSTLTRADIVSLIHSELEIQKETQVTLPSIDAYIKNLDLISKTEMESILVQNSLNERATTEYYLENCVNSKIELMHEEKLIHPIIENILTQIIQTDSLILLDNNLPCEEEDECAKTKFEEMIEPAVARIVQRIIKYDYAHDKTLFPSETNSLNLDINYDEVYDYEMQEQGHFEAPQIEVKSQQPPPGMNNPMHVESPDSISAVFKKEDNTKYYTNELRSDPKYSSKWLRFGNGIETGTVIDMVLDRINKKIYIVGHFKHVNRIPIDNVACYDMTAKTWSSVGNGIPSVVTCVAVYEENQIIFVGGVFSKVGKGENQIQAQNIASYNVVDNKWSTLGQGLNRDCNTLVLDKNKNKLYAGGTFTHTGTQSMHYVGIYDLETNSWNGLFEGEINGPCRVLLKSNETDLYIGGIFTHAGNKDIHASYVAKYDLEKQTWSDLSGGLQGYCNALAYDASENVVYVGGTFNSVGNKETTKDAHHIAKYCISNQTWNTMDGGVNNVVNSLCFDDIEKCLYVGGIFTHTYEEHILLNRVAKYIPKENKWTSLENHFILPTDEEGNDSVGLNGLCRVMSMDDKSLFVAGSFQIAGSITANSIVRYVVNREGET